jgi:hypothetical protein
MVTSVVAVTHLAITTRATAAIYRAKAVEMKHVVDTGLIQFYSSNKVIFISRLIERIGDTGQ